MIKLDLRAEECPMAFVKTKVALQSMRRGSMLEVLLCGEEPLENVPKAVEEGGDKILSIEALGGGICKIAIEKG
jgi:tRNA 2-thiouridine synthesizing protein A